eukprot:CAMPEP_0119354474 /NCGR_PEP_ID=MMETSP1334-20130426/3472_1 /TAXON_ID=127549 /ORGANISM="Calcidiscus leptoporus, Strain RCC1130" /LENGTH=353 /DNA_ID=CAMNT_0007368039 /DNA_START=1 /DNA_END=1062 /DNA_ORIENTATION=+
MTIPRAILRSARWHTHLVDRGVLSVHGPDARKLLNGLCTADVMAHDTAQGAQLTAFLNAQGRLQTGALLAYGDEVALIDVERAALPALLKLLKRYKLRSNAHITDRSDELAVVATSATVDEPQMRLGRSGCGLWRDPRLPYLGWRGILPRADAEKMHIAGSVCAPSSLYDLQLLLLGIPNRQMDTPAAEALPLESNLDLLGGVSFDKGCYLGQELTARTFFRGVTRKRLLPVLRQPLAEAEATAAADVEALSALPTAERLLAARLPRGLDGELLLSGAVPPAAELNALTDKAGQLAGKLRVLDASAGLGLALCRLDALGGELATAAGEQFVPLRPSWWPDYIEAHADVARPRA